MVCYGIRLPASIDRGETAGLWAAKKKDSSTTLSLRLRHVPDEQFQAFAFSQVVVGSSFRFQQNDTHAVSDNAAWQLEPNDRQSTHSLMDAANCR